MSSSSGTQILYVKLETVGRMALQFQMNFYLLLVLFGLLFLSILHLAGVFQTVCLVVEKIRSCVLKRWLEQGVQINIHY